MRFTAGRPIGSILGLSESEEKVHGYPGYNISIAGEKPVESEDKHDSINVCGSHGVKKCPTCIKPKPTEAGVKRICGFCYKYDCDCVKKEEAGVKMEWCECNPGYARGPHWKFCPICGTPRPVEKSMRERLAERMYSEMNYDTWDDRTDKQERNYLKLSDIAIKFIEEENEKKA